MRLFSISVLGLLLIIFLLIPAAAVFFFNYSKITNTLKLSFQNNFSQKASLPLSSFDKLGIASTLTNGSTVFWQDGMFLYKSYDVNQNSPVPPYALTGQVKAASDRYFEIIPFSKAKSFLNSQQKVTVQLLEENSDVATLQRKNGKIVSNLLFYTLIKPGDIVEIRSLKPVNKDTYATTQIFVLLP